MTLSLSRITSGSQTDVNPGAVSLGLSSLMTEPRYGQSVGLICRDCCPCVRVTGQDPVAAGVMEVAVRADRAHDGELVRSGRGAGQKLAEPDARDVGLDRPNSPRISAGASGLGSNVSCCGGPPCSHRKMTFFARPNERLDAWPLPGLSLASSNVGSDNPSVLRPPTRNSSRREIPSHSRVRSIVNRQPIVHHGVIFAERSCDGNRSPGAMSRFSANGRPPRLGAPSRPPDHLPHRNLTLTRNRTLELDPLRAFVVALVPASHVALADGSEIKMRSKIMKMIKIKTKIKIMMTMTIMMRYNPGGKFDTVKPPRGLVTPRPWPSPGRRTRPAQRDTHPTREC